MNSLTTSPFVYPEEGLFYFEFERQFVDAGLKCIPMCVRYKLDTVGIKLSLGTWCKLNRKERLCLATFACYTEEDINRYDTYLTTLIWNYEHAKPERLPKVSNTADLTLEIYNRVLLRCDQYGIVIKWNDWMSLMELERFALSKLLRPGHESKNFVPALKEFGLLNKWTGQDNE